MTAPASSAATKRRRVRHRAPPAGGPLTEVSIPTDPHQLLNVHQVAKLIHSTPGTVYKWLERGPQRKVDGTTGATEEEPRVTFGPKLPCVRQGARVLFDRAAVLKWQAAVNAWRDRGDAGADVVQLHPGSTT